LSIEDTKYCAFDAPRLLYYSTTTDDVKIMYNSNLQSGSSSFRGFRLYFEGICLLMQKLVGNSHWNTKKSWYLGLGLVLKPKTQTQIQTQILSHLLALNRLKIAFKLI
jgi:hypothetical protein